MRVSVIIPTYCRAPLLCEAIDSVLAQDFDDLEVIVVDDGSTDETGAMMHKYGAQVRYVRQSNQGLSTARNEGLSMARGEFIALLDDDDWWMPGKLMLQVQVLDKLPELAGVFTNFSIHKGDDNVIPNGIQTWYETPMDWREIMERTVTARDLLGDCSYAEPDTLLHIGRLFEASLEHYFVLPSTALFRRSHVPSDVRFPPHDPICGDWDFFARLSRDAPLCFIDYDTTFNRSHNDEFRLTRTRAIRQLELRIDFLERVYSSDTDFYTANRYKVDRVWKERLAQLCLLQLLDSDRKSARANAAKFRTIGNPATMTQRLILRALYDPGCWHADACRPLC